VNKKRKKGVANGRLFSFPFLAEQEVSAG